MPVFEDYRKRFPSPEAACRAGLDAIRELIRPLGLLWRAEKILELSASLVSDHRGLVPNDPVALRALPGVGPYAAAAFESLHQGRRAAIVDSNVVRLSARLYRLSAGPESRRRRAFLDLAEALTPKRAFKDYNYGVLDLTRTICTAKSPRCGECPLRTLCPSSTAG